MGKNCPFFNKKRSPTNGSHEWETIWESTESVEGNVNGLRQTDIGIHLRDKSFHLWDPFEGEKWRWRIRFPHVSVCGRLFYICGRIFSLCGRLFSIYGRLFSIKGKQFSLNRNHFRKKIFTLTDPFVGDYFPSVGDYFPFMGDYFPLIGITFGRKFSL